MATYKNIRVPVGKSGKTRLQRVQVLASGKYKFVKNIKKASSGGSKKKNPGRRSTRNVRKTGKGKAFRVLGGAGLLEDLAWGFMGFNLFGQTPAALPFTRAVQGLAGLAMNRRGKGRLVYALIDLLDIWLSGGMGASAGISNGGGIIQVLDAARQQLKILPLA